MSHKYRLPRSVLNVNGTPTLVYLPEWAQLRLPADQLADFEKEFEPLYNIIDSKLEDGSLVEQQIEEDDVVVATEYEFNEPFTIPDVLHKWLAVMQRDPDIITFKSIEYL
jgi:hypothetical protein